MTAEERKSFQTRHYAEAIRYMDNAKEFLKRAEKGRMHYHDPKYVRVACGTAYSGLLIALEAWLTLKGVNIPARKDHKPKKSIEFYLDQVAELDKKMLSYLNSAYTVLYLNGYYDGVTSVPVIKGGFDNAYWLIDKIKPAA